MLPLDHNPDETVEISSVASTQGKTNLFLRIHRIHSGLHYFKDGVTQTLILQYKKIRSTSKEIQ